MAHFPILARRACATGDGVIALRAIEPGEQLLTFRGPVYETHEHRAQLAAGAPDLYLQIADDLYIGPGGGLDDWINHSCEPNCCLRFAADGIHLVAVIHIEPGAQVTFDYATSQNDYPFRFRCTCGAATCRGEIGDFDELPSALKWRYHHAGMLAPWLSGPLVRRARRRLADEPLPPKQSPATQAPKDQERLPSATSYPDRAHRPTRTRPRSDPAWP